MDDDAIGPDDVINPRLVKVLFIQLAPSIQNSIWTKTSIVYGIGREPLGLFCVTIIS